MIPRPYRLGRREAAVEETRERVVRAAREIFSEEGFFEATLDDVAKRAGVARATVYYQFKSKFGLLEAAIDGAIAQQSLDGLRAAIQYPTPVEGLRHYVREICSFWSRDFVFYRNVTGLAAIDPEAARAVDGYDIRRREPLVFLAKRLDDVGALRARLAPRHATDAIWALTSFRSFDHLSTRNKLSLTRATDVMQGVADGLLRDDARVPLKASAR